MSHAVYKDRIKETTNTTGTGTYALGGAINGFRGFSTIGAGNACYYCCEDGTNWEIGSGHYTTGALTRFPIVTSNSDALVNWGGGTRYIYLVLPASQIGAVDGSSALDDMSDVTIASPQFRQRLSYNGSTWIASGISIGDIPSGITTQMISSGTVTGDEFGRLAGVTSAIQTQLNGKSSTSHTHTLDDLSDAVITLPTYKQRLAYNGTTWVNSGLYVADIPSGLSAEILASGTASPTKSVMGDLSWGFTTGPLKTATDGSTITFNLNDSSLWNVTLGGNRTLALASGLLGQRFFIRLTQDETGSRTVTWFAGANWPGGTAPTLTTTANKADWFGFVNISGSTYDGFTMGQNY